MGADYVFLPRAEIPDSAWDDFVDRVDETWFWHRPEFIDARALYQNSRDASFGVFDKHGRLVAVTPLYEIVGQRYSRACDATRWLYSEGGPAIAYARGSRARKRLTAALTEHLTALIEERRALYLDARVATLAPFLHGDGAPRANPLYELGFENTSSATWLVDLRAPLEEIRRRYSQLTRRLLKHAQRDQFIVREAGGRRDLEVYFELHLETVDRLKTEPEPFEFFEPSFERIRRKGRVRILFLERDGRLMAANTTIIDKNAAYYWTGASRTEKGGGEGRVLFDEQIAHAHRRGCVCYEAGKAYVPGDNAALVRGTSTFKRSFGSELVTSYSGRIWAPEKPPAPNAFTRLLFQMAGRQRTPGAKAHDAHCGN
jgi:hypothetical protein